MTKSRISRLSAGASKGADISRLVTNTSMSRNFRRRLCEADILMNDQIPMLYFNLYGESYQRMFLINAKRKT